MAEIRSVFFVFVIEARLKLTKLSAVVVCGGGGGQCGDVAISATRRVWTLTTTTTTSATAPTTTTTETTRRRVISVAVEIEAQNWTRTLFFVKIKKIQIRFLLSCMFWWDWDCVSQGCFGLFGWLDGWIDELFKSKQPHHLHVYQLWEKRRPVKSIKRDDCVAAP